MRTAPAAYRVALSAVISDLPDENGVALVGDVAGGWAFRVSDDQGVPLHRAASTCAGSRDDAMRCALLSALLHVPRGMAVHLALDTVEDVQLLSQLIQRDPGVRRALSGRMRSAELCPEDRDVWQARFAAERVAKLRLGSDASDSRGRSNRGAGMDEAPWPRRTVLPTAGRAHPGSLLPASGEHDGVRKGWLSRSLKMLLAVSPAGHGSFAGEPKLQAGPTPGEQPVAASGGSIEDWLQELDASVATIREGLREPRDTGR